MQAYRGLPCSMHSMHLAIAIGLGTAKGDFHDYIGKGHYVGRQSWS